MYEYDDDNDDLFVVSVRFVVEKTAALYDDDNFATVWRLKWLCHGENACVMVKAPLVRLKSQSDGESGFTTGKVTT